MREGKNKLVVVGLFFLACLVWLLMLVLWYGPAGECSSSGESRPANESVAEELPRSAERSATLQQQLLDFAWSDPNLTAAAAELSGPLKKVELDGDFPLPEDAVLVAVLTETPANEPAKAEAKSLRARSAFIHHRLAPTAWNRPPEEGWRDRWLRGDLFETHIAQMLQASPRHPDINWFAASAMGAKLAKLNKAALRSDQTHVLSFLQEEHRLGVIVPSLHFFARHCGVDLVAASAVATMTDAPEIAVKVLVGCASRADAEDFVRVVHALRKGALEHLASGDVNEPANVAHPGTRVADCISGMAVDRLESTVRIRGRVLDSSVCRALLAMVTRKDRDAKGAASWDWHHDALPKKRCHLFEVHGNRVYHVNRREMMEGLAEQLTAINALETVEDRITALASLEIHDTDYSLVNEALPTGVIQLAARGDGGTRIEEIDDPTSAFQRALNALRSADEMLYFIVRQGGQETYRKVAETGSRRGFEVAHENRERDAPIAFVVGCMRIAEFSRWTCERGKGQHEAK